jgi:putative Mg2+ transporter-C (MgtC) family protein
VSLVSLSTTLQFLLHLMVALLLGAAVGLERQWRQRMAGTRTNALVAAGASSFVMAGMLIQGDPSSAGRIASYVVSGVGFLGAGVIFKDGGTVRGLNTAATIWCSAAIGVLSGFGHMELALVLALAVLFTNIGLRRISFLVQPVLPVSEASEGHYLLELTCLATDETHLRTLLLSTISSAPVSLQAIHSEDEPNNRTRLRAEILVAGQSHRLIEDIALRLSMEPGVSSLSWSVVPTAME